MSGGWYEEVAAKSKVDIVEVEEILRRRGIRAKPGIARVRKLRIASVRFSGQKMGETTDRFDFQWDGLGDGVWAVASHDSNLVGKSTVLEVVLWCLRGAPKRLQDDIRKWLENVRLEFMLDGDRYVVAFDIADETPSGSLVLVRPDGVPETLDTFSSHEGFGFAMSRFMMEALDLDAVPSQSGKDEAAMLVEHGWPALSSGLYFGGEHDHLLGDTQMAGLPGRILQLYVGLPWASTVMQASAAEKQTGTERKVGKALVAAAAERNADARARIAADLERERDRLAKMDTAATFVGNLEDLAAEVVRTTKVHLELDGRLAVAEDEATSLLVTADADAREVRDIREGFVATSFFNGLQPTCCPRCETGVSKERIKREASDFSCSVCSERIDPERMEDVNERLEEAGARAVATRAAFDRANAQLPALRRSLANAKTAMEGARRELETASTSATLRDRREAELEVARLEGALGTLEESVAEEPNLDRKVVKAAHDIAKEAMDTAGQTMFMALNAEVLDLARRFGMVALESVSINAQGHMALRKGGADTRFGAVTKGERLRLRLATAIGLLRIGQRLGVGRHPGLLLVDSPSAEETEETNLEALLKELRDVADGEVGLQVFVSSAKAEKVLEVLAPENCRVAAKGQPLW